ncbi:MAG: T9SS type A sorting domain-containing protein [Candidatus Delongbacteria bacterium]
MRLMLNLRTAGLAGLLSISALSGTAGALESISLHSGNGPLGGLDGQIQLLVGPANGPFAAAFTPADFSGADLGAPASIISNHGAWIPNLGDGISQWISTGPGGAGEGGSALYSQEFFVATPAVGAALLDFHFAVDNVLGSGPNVGVYLNGQPVPGTMGGNFNGHYTFLGLGVGDLLQPGLNRLYVYAVDLGGPGGLLYRADFSIEEDQTVGATNLPTAFRLQDAVPNPFNPSTDIAFELLETGPARLSVFNLLGQEVAVLVDGLTARGPQRVRFEAGQLPAGLYFYTLQAGGQSETRKLLLVK